MAATEAASGAGRRGEGFVKGTGRPGSGLFFLGPWRHNGGLRTLRGLGMAQAWLLHKIIDGFCGRAYPAHQDYHSVWNSAEWKHVLEDVTTFFKAVVGKNFSEEETLQQLNQLNSCHQEAVLKCLKSRRNEIKQALLGEIVDISCAQLQDFDWQLKLALSSDKIATLQMPLLNLHLDVKEDDKVKPYTVEMSKEELQSLISSLEAANKVVLQLK